MKKTIVYALLLCLLGLNQTVLAEGPAAESGAVANPYSLGPASTSSGSALGASPNAFGTQGNAAQQYGSGNQSNMGAQQQYGVDNQGTMGAQQYGFGNQGNMGAQQYGVGNQGNMGAQQYGVGNQGTMGAQQYGVGNQGTMGAQPYGFGNPCSMGAQQDGFGNPCSRGAQQYGFGKQGSMGAQQYGYGNQRNMRAQQYGFGMQAGRTMPSNIPATGLYPINNDQGAVFPVTPQNPPNTTAGTNTNFPTSTQLNMSLLERSMSADGEQDMMRPRPFTVGTITQFGYNFFLDPLVFAPLIDVPVGPDYIIGPGDTLIVTTWGSVDGVLALEVNRSGEITLPKVGALKVWGVTFAKVPELIRASLSHVFKNVQLNVTMGKLKLMRVYLVGEVTSPGGYDISSLSTVINALAAAGGPTKNGSLRSIQVMRNGKRVETVDLYNFFLKGDKSCDIRLQPGDTVNVPIIGSVAGIAGNVRRPAIYELKDEKTLKDAIELAGGLNPSGYLNRLQISRLEAHKKKLIADFSLDPKLTDKELEEKTRGITVQDQDLVKIFPIDLTVRDNVRLDGYVLRPGLYALKPGMRVRDLIGKDNILPETYPDTLEITRLFPPDFHPETMFVSLDQAMKGNETDNLLLTEFDTVRVFSRWEMQEMPKVKIIGEVQRPGDYRLLDKMTLRDLVLAAGNVKKTAFLNNIELTRSDIVDGTIKSHTVNLNLMSALKGNTKDNLFLKDMDEVVVRRIPDWKEETERYATIAGEVRFPGVYPIFPGERLSSLISRAGGYTERAYLRGAKFTRRSVAEIQQKRMEEIISRAEGEIMQKQQDLSSSAQSKDDLDAAKNALTSMKASLDKLKQTKSEGRISMQLASVDKLINTPNDLTLQGGDTLTIPQSTNAVQIFGEVHNPTTVIHIPGKKLEYYLKQAGGATKNADADEMYVLLADGTVRSRSDSGGFFSSDGFFSLRLGPGDTIVVPQNYDRVSWMKEIKDIAAIIGNLALAAGVVLK